MLDLVYGKSLDAYKRAAADAGISERMVEAIYGYVEHGVRPGHFWYAVLSDSLSRAVNRADDENRLRLDKYVQFMMWCIPGDAWGSEKKVQAWIAKAKGGKGESR